jgi:hypothetical protein
MTLRLMESFRRPWRIAVSAVLMVGYLVLMGESIHCQYVSDAPQEHHHSSSSAPPLSHQTHCLAANHGATATIHSVVLSPIDIPNQIGFLLTKNHPVPDSRFIAPGTARAPPTV